MATTKKNRRRSAGETRRPGSVRAPGKNGQRPRDDKAVREAAAFYRKAVSRPDIRAILEDLAKL